MIEKIKALINGGMVMLPQHFYEQGFFIKEDEHGDEHIYRYIPNKEDEVETNEDILELILDEDKVIWRIENPMDKEGFIQLSIEAFGEYFYGDEYTGIAQTNCICNRCGSVNVVKELNKDINYPYFCIECGENKYQTEVVYNTIEDIEEE